MAPTHRGSVGSVRSIVETTPLLSPPEELLPSDPRAIENEDDEETAVSDSEDVTPTNTRPSPVKVVLVLIVGVFIAQLDSSFVMATHTNIASEFGQLESSSWLVASYVLAMCAVQPCYGKISDLFGRKQSLIAAYTLFAIGTAICGFSTSFSVVIIGRVITGIGGAGANALVSLIMLDLVPLRELATLRSYVNIVATTGRSLGGPIGGILADTIGWRWSFILQSPLLLASTLLVYLFVPQKAAQEDDRPGISKFARIDFAGAALLAVTITSFMFVLELTGQKLSWGHPIIISLIITSVIAGSLFAVNERLWAAEPVFPLELLGNRAVVCAYMVLMLQGAAQFSMMFCVPLYFQVTQNASSTVAGAHLFPAVGGNALGALVAGIIIKKTGRTKILSIFATISGALCYTLLILRWGRHTNFLESLYIIPGGFGMGMAEASVFISLSAAVDRSIQAIALSGLFLAVSVGMIAGLSTSGSILQVTLTRELQERLTDFDGKEEIIRKSVSDIKYVLQLTGPLKELIVAAYVRALEYAHGVSLLASLLALLFAISAPQRRLAD